MARKASGNTSSSNTSVDGTDDLWKDIYVSIADTSIDSQHELLIGFEKLNRYTGDEVKQKIKYRFAHPAKDIEC